MAYREWKIKKSGGRMRLLEVPDRELKRLHRQVSDKLKKMPYKFPAYVTGTFGKTAGTHNTASPHVDQDIVIRFDIKNFFTSVTKHMVYKSLTEIVGLNRLQAAAIANMCTRKDHLPQGSPSSSILANIAAIRLHQALHAYAESNGCRYSIYVDDMYFSGPMKSELDRKVEKIRSIAQKFGFDMSPEKIKVMKRGRKQQIMDVCVTGATEWAHQHIRLSKYKRKQLICAIHNLDCLKPKNSVPHIRGLLSNAKRVGDQSYEKMLEKFKIALTKWRAYLDENPVVLKYVPPEVNDVGSEHSNI